jgi:hypothetical protein
VRFSRGAFLFARGVPASSNQWHTAVPKNPIWRSMPKGAIEKTLYLQWFYAIRIVGIAKAKE